MLLTENLQEALDTCIQIGPQSLTVSDVAHVRSANGEVPTSAASVLTLIGALGLLEQRMAELAKGVVAKLVQPLLASSDMSLAVSDRTDHSTQLLLRSTSAQQADAKLSGLQELVSTIRGALFSGNTIRQARTAFFTNFAPPVQTLLEKKMLESSMPSSSDPVQLQQFYATCQAATDFERDHLLIDSDMPAQLAEWSALAGTHWAQSLIQGAFSQLRLEIVLPDFWNQTETVEWLSQTTAIAESAANGHIQHASPQGAYDIGTEVAHDPLENNIEEDAWGLEADFETQSHAAPASPLPDLRKKQLVAESPDPNTDDAWGFHEDEPTSEQADITLIAQSKTALEPLADTEAEEEDGGWAFDDEAVEIGSEAGSLTSHSRKAPLEDGWDAWSKPEDEQALHPIGKPTKVVKGRLGASKSNSMSDSHAQAMPAVASTSKPLPQVVSGPFLTQSVQQRIAVPIPEVPENMLVSTRSRRILQIAEGILLAASSVLEAGSVEQFLISSGPCADEISS